MRSSFPDLCPSTFVRSSAPARGRFDGWRSPVTPGTSTAPTNWPSNSSRTTRFSRAGCGWRAAVSLSRDCPRASAGSATASAPAWAQAINDLVRKGEISAPIAMGRDHLDTGSVASPYRETERMLDGSDAVADWPILNALLNTASGATWVSFHHGGGVGMGYSLHAGQVTVADGTEMAARKIERVLNNDPGLGRGSPRRCGLRVGATNRASNAASPYPWRKNDCVRIACSCQHRATRHACGTRTSARGRGTQRVGR